MFLGKIIREREQALAYFEAKPIVELPNRGVAAHDRTANDQLFTLGSKTNAAVIAVLLIDNEPRLADCRQPKMRRAVPRRL